MTAVWVFTPEGKPAFYKSDGYYYDPQGKCLYFQSDEYLYPIGGGGPALYISDNWLFSMGGKPAFYFGKAS